MTWSVAPDFMVADVVAAAAFYRDRLGFHYDRLFGDPPSFCMVKRSGIVIMLSQGAPHPNHLRGPENDTWDAYVWVENADALYDELTRKGVKITRPICDQPYGNRDFDVEDCDGYRICFGSDIE